MNVEYMNLVGQDEEDPIRVRIVQIINGTPVAIGVIDNVENVDELAKEIAENDFVSLYTETEDIIVVSRTHGPLLLEKIK